MPLGEVNTIGQVFAKLKHFPRNATRRTVEALWQEIGNLLERFPPEECRNYLRISGY